MRLLFFMLIALGVISCQDDNRFIFVEFLDDGQIAQVYHNGYAFWESGDTVLIECTQGVLDSQPIDRMRMYGYFNYSLAAQFIDNGSENWVIKEWRPAIVR